MNERIIVKKKTFRLLNRRAYKPVYVYKGPNQFLRDGPKSLIAKEYKLHKRLLKLGFPFAEIIFTRSNNNRKYFIEKSLGEYHFGQIFSEDLIKQKEISKKKFKKFLAVTKQYAEAQLKTADQRRNLKSFARGINFLNIRKELPNFRKKISFVFSIINERLKAFPFVLTHGDFSPFNIYPRGVIDIESFFSAPAGYDLISNICHTDFFPRNRKYEMHQVYRFSKSQKNEYLALVDRIYQGKALPRLSDYYEDYYVCRCIWTTARMQKWPKIQQWRYKQLERVLNKYLRNVQKKL